MICYWNRLLNADATNQNTSTVNAPNSFGNKQLWNDSHYISVSLVPKLFEGNNLNSNENVTKDLKSTRLNPNSQHLSIFIDGMRIYLNSFSPEINQEKIFNITTGKTTTLETNKFLLNARKMGEGIVRQFMDQCVDNTKF